MRADFYASHPVFDDFDKNDAFQNPDHLFHLALSFSSTESFDGNRISAICSEAKLNAENFKFSPFLCILALANALQQKIECYYPIENERASERNVYEHFFNQTVYPSVALDPNKDAIHIFRCAITPHDFVFKSTFPKSKNHFVPLLPPENLNSHGRTTNRLQEVKTTHLTLQQLPVPSFLLSDYDQRLPTTNIMKETLQSTSGIQNQNVIVSPPVKKKQLSINQFFSSKSLHTSSTTKGLEEPEVCHIACASDPTILFPSAPSLESSNVKQDYLHSTIQQRPSHANDIGNHYNLVNSMFDGQKYDLLCNVWKPSIGFNFPPSSSGRRFQIKWLDEFKWLTYSSLLDGAFCLNCVLFGGESTHNASKLSCLFKQPFRSWAVAIRRFHDHAAKSAVHKTATLRCCQFKAVMENKESSIKVKCDTAVLRQVELNRKKLLPIVEAIILCGRQNIPLRGHRDDSSSYDEVSSNPGNFQAILNYLVKCGNNVLFDEHLRNAPKSATYRSKTTQNEVIGICKRLITDHLVKEIRSSIYFSILADEASDISNCEQMAFVIRFVDESALIREAFLGFFPCTEGLSGKAIAKQIITAVHTLGLDMNLCRGQGYDGAGNMSGKYNGASTIVTNQYPKAIYVHCKSHLLNLCVASSCDLELARNMMGHVKSVSDFFNVHPKHFALLQEQIEKLLPTSRHKHLLDVCRTRWISRIDGLDVFLEIIVAVVGSLEIVKCNVDRSWSPNSSKDALSLFFATVSFQFIVSLVIVARILEVTRPLTKQLQSASIDATEAIENITLLFSMLMRLRNEIDSVHEEWYTEAVSIASKMGTIPVQPRTVTVQVHRSNAPASSPSEYYKRNLTIPFLDHLTNEIQRRFSGVNTDLLNAFYGLPKVVVRDSNWLPKFRKFLSLYEDDLPEPRYILTELKTWETKWKISKSALPSKLCDVLPLIDKLTFPNINAALRLAATFPVTSCSCERSVSVLRRLKTYLRNTMSQERMNGLALLNVHREISVSAEEVIEHFARDNPRRMKLRDILSEQTSR